MGGCMVLATQQDTTQCIYNAFLALTDRVSTLEKRVNMLTPPGTIVMPVTPHPTGTVTVPVSGNQQSANQSSQTTQAPAAKQTAPAQQTPTAKPKIVTIIPCSDNCPNIKPVYVYDGVTDKSSCDGLGGTFDSYFNGWTMKMVYYCTVNPQPSSGGQTQSSSQSPSVTNIAQGASSQGVQTIQQFLQAEGSFTYPTVTGYYGTITKNAVENFQQKNALPVTGIVDQATLQKMNALVPQVAPTLQTSIQSIMTQGQ